jgi:hypothetical protein
VLLHGLLLFGSLGDIDVHEIKVLRRLFLLNRWFFFLFFILMTLIRLTSLELHIHLLSLDDAHIISLFILHQSDHRTLRNGGLHGRRSRPATTITTLGALRSAPHLLLLFLLVRFLNVQVVRTISSSALS